MRTPEEFTKNLKNGIITGSMLEAALYSVNKRAKNWRNKKREYRGMWYDRYHNYEKAEANEQNMYAKKETLLSVLQPVCIHKELAGYGRTRVYDYEEDYMDQMIDRAFRGQIVWWNSYLDREDYQEVYFFDYIDKNSPRYRYYMYYQTGSRSFHTPITEEQASSSGLPVRKIGTLRTEGDAIQDLVSMQFVDKLLALVRSGQYQYVAGKEPEYGWDREDEDVEEYTDCYGADTFWDAIFKDIRRDVQAAFEAAPLQQDEPYTLSEEDRQKLDRKAKNSYDSQLRNKKGRRWKCPSVHTASLYVPFSNGLQKTALDLAGGGPVTRECLVQAAVAEAPEAYREYMARAASDRAENAYLTEKWQRMLQEAGYAAPGKTPIAG